MEEWTPVICHFGAPVGEGWAMSCAGLPDAVRGCCCLLTVDGARGTSKVSLRVFSFSVRAACSCLQCCSSLVCSLLEAKPNRLLCSCWPPPPLRPFLPVSSTGNCSTTTGCCCCCCGCCCCLGLRPPVLYTMLGDLCSSAAAVGETAAAAKGVVAPALAIDRGTRICCGWSPVPNDPVRVSGVVSLLSLAGSLISARSSGHSSKVKAANAGGGKRSAEGWSLLASLISSFSVAGPLPEPEREIPPPERTFSLRKAQRRRQVEDISGPREATRLIRSQPTSK